MAKSQPAYGNKPGGEFDTQDTLDKPGHAAPSQGGDYESCEPRRRQLPPQRRGRGEDYLLRVMPHLAVSQTG